MLKNEVKFLVILYFYKVDLWINFINIFFIQYCLFIKFFGIYNNECKFYYILNIKKE